ncbi:hypothetical protein GRF29_106g171284 [Pseudopithomyces chartarum]|uniref:Uncharacterized protein n=1 Tax=Pseudopithomyces chartarum TaxID=1892770 RepID=A0AAN6LV19_9PLEO|nr:hypothetical protein GRF29_106g171284 [Pseudopithomyces chartarum]
MYEESVSEPEDVRMARLHSLLTKSKTPLLPIQNKNPRRTPSVPSQTEDHYGKPILSKRLTFNTPPRASPFPEDTTSPFDPPPKQSQESPSRPLRTIKPPPISPLRMAHSRPPQPPQIIRL